MSGCSLLEKSGGSDAKTTETTNINEIFFPSQIGSYKRIDEPKSPSGLTYNGVSAAAEARYSAADNDKNYFYLTYYRSNYAAGLKEQVEWEIHVDKSKDCKAEDPEDLEKVRNESTPYKIVGREQKNGGEIIILQADPNSYCSPKDLNRYERFYFLRGNVVFIVNRYDVKDYGAAEQFMIQYLEATKKDESYIFYTFK